MVGCVDLTNPDNGGLDFPINALNATVLKYESQGLSRTDIWMLAAYVAVQVTNANAALSIPFPFQWVGRKTCEEMHSNNNCGIGLNGQQAPCNQFSGPNREICHGDTFGTETIHQYMLKQYGFDAQQTAAIMGAHTIGRMNPKDVGFSAPNGWDLTNTVFDQGYFVELVGMPNIPAADWKQVHLSNSQFSTPPRWQFTATRRNINMNMLNADLALVRNFTEGVNLMSSGRITCDFSGSNACSNNTPFIPFVTRYANDLSTFLSDFRDALGLLTSNGYAMDKTCSSNEVCVLRSLN
jgi:hypothetical protein